MAGIGAWRCNYFSVSNLCMRKLSDVLYIREGIPPSIAARSFDLTTYQVLR